MRDYKQMQEIQKLKKQAEAEAETENAESEISENEKYSHKGTGFSGGFEYFREYYKWPALIVLIIVVALFIGFRQLAAKSDPDLSMMYVGPDYLSYDDQEKVKDTAALLSGDLAGDYNGDDRYVANFLDLTVNYAQNAEGYRVLTKDDEDTTYTRFQTELRAGDTLLYFLDPYYYRIVKDEGILQPLDEILSDASVSFDGYGVHLGDLEARFLPGLERMPSRTVLCLRQSPSEDAIRYNRTESAWAHHRDLLELLVAYKPEEPRFPVIGGNPDATLFYVGTSEIYGDTRLPMENFLSSLSADGNGDGNRLVKLKMLLRTGSDAAKAVTAKAARTELRTGSSCIFLLDKEAYIYAKEHDLLEPLPDALKNSAATEDGYGLKLNKLPLFETDGFYDADPDAMLCLRKNPENRSENYGLTSKNWENAKEIFIKLAEYEK